MRFFHTLLLMAILSIAHAQTTQTFSNTADIAVADGQIGVPYPSEIEVSGMPPFLVDVRVRINNLIILGTAADLDMLLETPDGQQFLLMSDVPINEFVNVFTNLDFNDQSPLLLDENTQFSNLGFRPSNYDVEPDNFPIIGETTDLPPSLLPLENTDPNGNWKLYLVDDNENAGTIEMENGWSVILTAQEQAVCPSVIDLAIDPASLTATTATLTWGAFGTPDSWEAYVVPDYEDAPTSASGATHTNLTDPNGSLIDGLLPGSPYQIYLRSNCGTSNTEWLGPIAFTTGFNCNWAINLEEDCIGWEAIYTGVHGFEQEECPIYENHKQLFRFTPSANGDYFINSNSEFIALDGYWGSVDNCLPSSWECLTIHPDYGQLYLPDLVAGAAYYLLLPSHPDEEFAPDYKLSSGPNAALEGAGFFEAGPFRVNLHLPLPEAFEGQALDYYVGLVEEEPIPDRFATPTHSMRQLNEQMDTLLGNIIPETNYFFLYRISSTGQLNCWEEPLFFTTDPYCGDIEEVFFTDQTALSTRITAVLPSEANAQLSWGIAPYTPTFLQLPGSVNNDTLRNVLPNLNPNSTYEVYAKTFCLGLSYANMQPWQGPYEFNTTDDCLALAEPIYCEQFNVNNFPVTDDIFFSMDAFCLFNEAGLDGDRLYTFYAEESGSRNITFRASFAPNNCQMSFFLKDVEDGCSLNGWEELGCWRASSGNNDVPTLYFEVEAGHTYYLKTLIYGTYNTGLSDVYFSFELRGCDNPCEEVSELFVAENILTWAPAGDENAWDIYYDLLPGGFSPEFSLPVLTVTQPSLDLSNLGLSPGQTYGFRVRANCGNDNHGLWESIEHTNVTAPIAVFEGSFTACNPVAALPNPFEMMEYPYEIIHFSPSEDGEYVFFGENNNITGRWALMLFEGNIDLESPYAQVFPLGIDPAEITIELTAEEDYWLYILPRFDYTLDASMNQEVPFQINLFGPAPLASGPNPVFAGKTDSQKGIVGGGNELLTQPYACVDTAGWMHFYDIGLDESTAYDDRLWLSVEYYPALGNFPEVIVTGEGVSLITNPPADYLQNPSGWYTMNRHWNLFAGPEMQPDGPKRVRFYFTPADFTAVQDAVATAGGQAPQNLEELTFYKINSQDNVFNPDPSLGHVGIPAAPAYDADGYWEYSYALQSSTENWRLGYHADGSPYAEYVIGSFSGGGGGSTGNGDGALTYLRELSSVDNWTVYPNPASERIYFRANSVSPLPEAYQISDLTGKLQVHGVYTNTGIPIDQLSAGVYLVNVSSEESWQVFQLVKH